MVIILLSFGMCSVVLFSYEFVFGERSSRYATNEATELVHSNVSG